MAYIKEADGVLRIGALTRHGDLEHSELIRSATHCWPIRPGSSPTPSSATWGPSADRLLMPTRQGIGAPRSWRQGRRSSPPGPKGSARCRSTTSSSIPSRPACSPTRVLTEVRVPQPVPRSGGAYLKLERKVGDFAIAAVGVALVLDGKGAVERAGIGLCNVGSTSLCARKAEDALKGKQPEAATLARAVEAAAGEADPVTDLRGPAEYKRDIVRVLTGRALRVALQRAKGGA